MVDGIINMILDVFNSIEQLGGGLIFTTPESFNGAVYQAIKSIIENSVKPVGYTFLSLFVLLELVQMSTKFDGNSGMLGLQLPVQLFFKVLLAKLLLDNTTLILEATTQMSTYIINQMAVEASSQTSLSAGIDQIRQTLNDMSWNDQLMIWLQSFIVWLFGKLSMLFVNVILIARMIEIYIYMALAPIPLSFAINSTFNSVTVNFVKSFFALALQGVIIFLVFYIFNSYITTLTFTTTASEFQDSMWQIVGSTFILMMSLFNTSRMAKSLTNAM